MQQHQVVISKSLVICVSVPSFFFKLSLPPLALGNPSLSWGRGKGGSRRVFPPSFPVYPSPPGRVGGRHVWERGKCIPGAICIRRPCSQFFVRGWEKKDYSNVLCFSWLDFFYLLLFLLRLWSTLMRAARSASPASWQAASGASRDTSTMSLSWWWLSPGASRPPAPCLWPGRASSTSRSCSSCLSTGSSVTRTSAGQSMARGGTCTAVTSGTGSYRGYSDQCTKFSASVLQ